jgi:3-hydroxybutyryl-CoA dehydrogenase
MMNKIAIIGAGQMGSGIAHVCAQAGVDVTLIDVGQAPLDKAMATIERNLDRQVSRGKTTELEKAEAIARIAPSTELDPAAACDLVIEAR